MAFTEELSIAGASVFVPELDEGDFEHLTITGQENVLNRAIGGEPVSLIGSSMGGYLASLYASRHPEVRKLVLLAPAFGFARRWMARLGEPKPSHFEVYHYGDQRMRRVRYDLLEDAARYPDAPDFPQPALIFHGIHDDVVPIDVSRAYAADHPNARLVELDSGHELLNVLDRIVADGVAFLHNTGA